MFISDLNLTGSPIFNLMCVKQSRTLENPSVLERATVRICSRKDDISFHDKYGRACFCVKRFCKRVLILKSFVLTKFVFALFEI